MSAQNPLGKIPVLILDDGRTIYDSNVIVEFLDSEAGGSKVIPRIAAALFDDLTSSERKELKRVLVKLLESLRARGIEVPAHDQD